MAQKGGDRKGSREALLSTARLDATMAENADAAGVFLEITQISSVPPLTERRVLFRRTLVTGHLEALYS